MKDRRFQLIGIPALSILIVLLVTPLHRLLASPADFFINWAISLYFTAALWLGNRALWAWLLRRLPHVSQTAQRLWALVGLSVLFTAAATVVLRVPLHAVLPSYFSYSLPAQLQAIGFNLLPTLVVNTLYESRYFFEQWKANLLRADQLARASTQAQLDALQSQLDPHFLFNNLNTLSALIEPGNAPAQQFVEQLADMYRYVLLAQGQPTVPLADEIAFVETYLALHKARFRDNLVVEICLPPAALARRVAPLSVQLLVENALKHNVASREHPLHLRLTATPEAPDFILIENTLRPRSAGLAPGTGTGLANVRQRYQLLNAAHCVQIEQPEGKFVVKLPLL
ncbi:histidine kinase [Hymenobacter sp. BT770]|uniref:sensor histidine kinase n=1 Tax=Hymenobacter sp. BT770 TaxID=2886942 RepID=UPI001D102C02|nr:histidine kinase [Hymenobacter sp. BT770]MCC3154626.1 histidine kinase [Hymenobacter sp. BT770]MDO3416679.1 histidine kinase [Hymenobacter sp. BT770]